MFLEANSKKWSKMAIAGWILSVPVAGMMAMSAFFKVMKGPELVTEFAKRNLPEASIIPIGIYEVVFIVLFLIPRTATFGAIMMTAFLGGVTCTNMTQSQSILPSIGFAVLAWVALILRDSRVRSILPVG